MNIYKIYKICKLKIFYIIILYIMNKKHDLEVNYENLKDALAIYNQRIAPSTDAKIMRIFKSIKEYEEEIKTINKNLEEYIKLLRDNKNARLDGKIITLESLNDMLAQNAKAVKKYEKTFFTLTSVFGKIHGKIESINSNNNNNNNNENDILQDI